MNKVLELKNKNNKTGQEQIVGTIQIKNQSSNSAELYFYGDIVSSTWGKWEKEDKCPQDVSDFLNEVKDVKNLFIYVNSGGGSVFAGISIYNMLKRHSAYKTVYVDGLAASISSVIALAGDKVVIPATAQFMIHSPWTYAVGNASNFRKTADDLDKIETSIINVYKENLRDGVDIEEIIEMVHKETWLNGEEASKYFNVEVSDELEAVACVSQYFNQYKNVPQNLMHGSFNRVFTNIPTDNVNKNIKAQKLKVELNLL